MVHRVSISAQEARRIALSAQGFSKARPKSANDIRHYRRAMAAIKVLQLDYVNVVLPAHFMMIWSRLGAYDRASFERYLYESDEYIEQWAHEASIVSCNDWPLLAHRRDEFQLWKSSPLHALAEKDQYLASVLDTVRRNGAVTSNDFSKPEIPMAKQGDWRRSMPRWALEHHFGRGRLAVRCRRPNFQRVYDLSERVIDEDIHTTRIDRFDAQREMLRRAADALGIATIHDLADYYRMSPREAAPRIEELVEEGVLAFVDVEGWSATTYLNRNARIPKKIPGASLLSPFDPMVWYRPRAKRIFGFEYRIEIYMPAAKRRWGYYVLPFREGDRITARVDLKADRRKSRLLVQQAHIERGVSIEPTATALANELCALASWLGLDEVVVIDTNASSAFGHALAVRTADR